MEKLDGDHPPDYKQVPILMLGNLRKSTRLAYSLTGGSQNETAIANWPWYSSQIGRNDGKMELKVYKLVFALFLAAPCLTSHAIPVPKCPTTNVSLAHQGAQIHRIVQLGPDGRTPFHPSKLPARHAASGLLNCGGDYSTAQLTGASDVITAASHAIFDDVTCKKKASCTFTPAGSSIAIEVDMDSTQGSCVNLEPGSNPPKYHWGKDWAVLKLKSTAEGIEPYAIPNEPVYLIGGEVITTVTVINPTKFATQECSFMYPRYYRTIPVLHDCDTQGHGSGGAQVDTANRLIAIHVGGSEKGGKGKDFELGLNFNSSVPLAGEFYEAVRRLVRPEAAQLGQ